MHSGAVTDLLAPADVGAPKPGAPLASRTRRWLRAHWALLVLLAVGAGLRVLTVLAYQPAILYIDSFSYLQKSVRPSGPDQRQALKPPLCPHGDILGL
jgi:hypothetical protein